MNIRCWNCKYEYVTSDNEPCNSCNDMLSNFELKLWMAREVEVCGDIVNSKQAETKKHFNLYEVI